MKQALFFTFLAILVVVVVATLLGLWGVLPIEERYLDKLVYGVIVETAGAVILLFGRTRFFGDQPDDGGKAQDDRADIIKVFPERSIKNQSEYDNLLLDVKNNIDIIGFGLRALREDYLDRFNIWMHQAHVRILLIDPEAPVAELPYADQRDSEEGNDAGTIGRDVRKFITDAAEMLRDPNDSRFQVRLYRCLPTLNLFRIDTRMFWGPYLIGQQSRSMPTLLVKQEGILYDRLLGHFEQIWQSEDLSRPVPEEWLTPSSTSQ